MDNKYVPYIETHRLQLNVYLLFYMYVFVILLIANILPAFTGNYFLFLFLGIAGIAVLFIKGTYTILIKQNMLELSIKIIFKLTLLKLKIEDIESIEEVKIDSLSCTEKPIKKEYTFHLFKKEDGIKLSMKDKKVFIISGINVNRLANRIIFLQVK